VDNGYDTLITCGGLLDQIERGRFEGCRDIVFVHTGGLFGLFPQWGGFNW